MKKKLAYVVAIPLTYNAFLKVHAQDLADDYDITVIANFGAEAAAPQLEAARALHVPIARDIAPGADLRALWQLWRIMRRERFDIVHTVIPKAGLLGMLAATLGGGARRVHHATGQVWATRTGAARTLLKTLDKTTMALAHRVLADSRSQVDFLRSEGFRSQPQVLEEGSIAGVDSEFFHPSPEARHRMRARHGIPEAAIVVSYLGRMNRDKGVPDLVEAFIRANLGPDAVLWLMGRDEEGLVPGIEARARETGARIGILGPTMEHADYLAASDIFSLPSYREGFGMTALEAAACGLPVVASKIPGLVDAVAEGETALTHPPGDVAALAACLERLAQEPELRARLGQAGRTRAVEKFSRPRITEAMRAFYRDL
ncbi:glycosyltransferase family 4 protein [Sagittula sp. S175]|uniref:glycosyltransferase family 4 protein n=1 Tax=Sagittula sp. S175 TaxID=3415129 RepID=UPI003C7B146F